MGINLAVLIKTKKKHKISHRASYGTDHSHDNIAILDDVLTSPQDDSTNSGKIDRKGWGQDLLGIGMGRWMAMGTRDWWMVNKHCSIMKKGGKIKNNLMRAVDDQGSHSSETRGPP
jgi:hypothetical protein